MMYRTETVNPTTDTHSSLEVLQIILKACKECIISAMMQYVYMYHILLKACRDNNQVEVNMQINIVSHKHTHNACLSSKPGLHYELISNKSQQAIWTEA